MSELAIKKRLRVAAERAILLLDDQGYQVQMAEGKPFHLIAVKNRKRRVKYIRIILDEITITDRRIVKRFAPDSKTISREFWLRKRGDRDFSIIPVP